MALSQQPRVLFRHDPLPPLDVQTTWTAQDLQTQLIPSELTNIIYEYAKPIPLYTIAYLSYKGVMMVEIQEGETTERLIEQVLLQHPNIAGHLGHIRGHYDGLYV
jgi:hypothetical protein